MVGNISPYLQTIKEGFVALALTQQSSLLDDIIASLFDDTNSKLGALASVLFSLLYMKAEKTSTQSKHKVLKVQEPRARYVVINGVVTNSTWLKNKNA